MHGLKVFCIRTFRSGSEILCRIRIQINSLHSDPLLRYRYNVLHRNVHQNSKSWKNHKNLIFIDVFLTFSNCAKNLPKSSILGLVPFSTKFTFKLWSKKAKSRFEINAAPVSGSGWNKSGYRYLYDGNNRHKIIK